MQGYLTKHKNVYELNILSKYFFHKGKTEEEVKYEVVKFCKKYDKHFNIEEWFKIINKTIKIAKHGQFITGKVVYITENELSYISKLEKLNEQKIAFTLLTLYKFYDYKKFEVSLEDLFKLCKLNLNSKSKLSLLQSLTSKGLIDINMGGKRWVTFAEKQGNTLIEIKNFDDFIYEYHKYLGEKSISNCELCKKAIKLTSNRKKYCHNCRKEKERTQWRENKRKLRENDKCPSLEI